jgi:putative tryptophan/tyrosine transport system substrate-binding protein
MKRRDFITLLGGAAAWPLGARAQQPAMPVIGFLSSLSASDATLITAAFYKGLSEAGYVHGGNVALQFRWAEGEYDRLPAMAADLVHRDVSVIAAISGTPSALAAKSATTTIPIVFAMGSDPVTSGLVASLNRPEGNVTGVTFFTAPLANKRLEIIRELAPSVTRIAVLVNPDNPPSMQEGKDASGVAQATGLHITVLTAGSASQIDSAFAGIVDQRLDGLYVSADPLFFNQRSQLVALTGRSRVPAIYADREIAEAGGLISYGASRADAYRQAGLYVGRILQGEKAGNLPVVLPTRFELVLNLKTAKTLGLEISPTLLATADEVIE